jgi:hypothetical protein
MYTKMIKALYNSDSNFWDSFNAVKTTAVIYYENWKADKEK